MIDIRKIHENLEETWHEGGPRRTQPLLVGTVAAVIRNPFAGRYAEDLMPFMAELKNLAMDLGRRLIRLVGSADKVEAYGKGAMIGEDGELEHGALWHEPGGWSMRELLGGTKAVVPAAKTVGTCGCRLIIPLGHVNAAYVRSHFGVAAISIWDAPRRQEIVYGLAMATGGRVHARCGGLDAAKIEGKDGLR